MAILSFSQLRTPISRSAARDQLISLLDELGFTASSWQVGGIQRTILETNALLWSELSQITSFAAAMAFPETAIGSALTLQASSFFQEERKAAINTQGKVLFTDASSGGPHTLALGTVVAKSSAGKTYRNIEAGVIPKDGSISVLFEAEVGEAASNVANDDITSLLTPIAGVIVNNPADPTSLTWITRSGSDAESDKDLRSRLPLKFADLAIIAVKDSVISVVLKSSDGAITRVQVQDDNPRGPGTVDVYMAAKLATAGAGDVTAAQAALTDRIFDGANAAHAIAATEQALNPAGVVYFDPLVGEAATTSAVNQAIDDLLADLPIGGSKISGALTNVLPLSDVVRAIETATGVTAVDLTTPSANLVVGLHSVVITGTSALTYSAVPSA